jgi:hypothetical protein
MGGQGQGLEGLDGSGACPGAWGAARARHKQHQGTHARRVPSLGQNRQRRRPGPDGIGVERGDGVARQMRQGALDAAAGIEDRGRLNRQRDIGVMGGQMRGDLFGASGQTGNVFRLADGASMFYTNTATGGDGGDTISNNPRKTEIIKSQLKTKGINDYVEIDDKIGKEIIELYLSGKYGCSLIGNKYGISKKRIMRFLKKENILLDKERSSKVNTFNPTIGLVTKIIDKYQNKKTIKDIASEENLTIMIVSRILHDSGIRESKRFKNGKRYDGKQPKNRKSNNQN